MLAYKHKETIEYLRIGLLSKKNEEFFPEFLRLRMRNFQGIIFI